MNDTLQHLSDLYIDRALAYERGDMEDCAALSRQIADVIQQLKEAKDGALDQA